ncbi:MAG: NAD(P)H-hydrate epimerase [Elusimicrobia bacterium]|nr:NAD(P)H-hydrate epimerase [Elusimicrobiota bacterium]
MTLLPAFHFKPVTAAEMRRRDAAAMERGLSEEVLMENAGHALAEGTLLFPHRGALVVCGGGNNGGDGLVAARWLIKAGRRVTVLLWRKPENYQNAARAHWRALCLPADRADLVAPASFAGPGEPVVDAFLGLGVRPPLSEEARTLIRWMNARRGPKIAADVPSGLDADRGRPLPEAVRARLTVTLGLPKKGLVLSRARPYVGKLVVGDLGFPPRLLRFTGGDTHRRVACSWWERRQARALANPRSWGGRAPVLWLCSRPAPA